MYQLWMHHTSGEVYAVRIEKNKVTGARGPLPYRAYTSKDMPELLPYIEYLTDDAKWIDTESENFTLYERR